ncbi:hypothetical protein [Algoriphagus sp. NG3]|uniref:hypothetical protein n=1 Tax=unclassified Algoriphagus TaxID=2641541 RepID=UPI002A823F7E|nr:hypothetical protein [Algoriphagus sp. NG3]WPR74795.1 hypothetical protein SLW71_19195 [Algoriphagus sp. NG3]
MIIRNDTSSHVFFALQEGRQETEEALVFSESHDSFTGRKAVYIIHIKEYEYKEFCE